MDAKDINNHFLPSQQSIGYGKKYSHQEQFSTTILSSASSHDKEKEIDERQKLEKQNFELKMKIYYMEENLKRFQDEEHRQELHQGAVKGEINNLRAQLEEAQIEVEQRDLLMVKASAAIEALKGELERCKTEIVKQGDIEFRMKGLKAMNEEVELEFHGQLKNMQNELSICRQKLMSKEQEKSLLEDRQKQMEVAIAHLQDRLSDGQLDKSRAEDRWIKAQEVLSTLEDELIQTRAHMELYKQRVQEESDEKERLKLQLKEQASHRDASDERNRQRLADVSSQYEAQLRSVRQSHDQDIENIRAGHAQMMADIRDNYQAEVAKLKAGMDRSVAELRLAESADISRIKDDCAARLQEKAEEIRSLRAMIETDRMRSDNLLLELEATRADLRERNGQIERFRAELGHKSDELSALGSVSADLQEAQRKIQELQDHLRKETLEKVHYSLKAEQLGTQLSAAQQAIKEKDAEIHVSKIEVSRLSHVSTELGNKTETVETVVRDNEKYKILHNKLQTELLEANHRIFTVQKELDQRVAEADKIQAELARLKTQLCEAETRAEDSKIEMLETKKLFQTEREQRLASEAALSEHRSVAVPMRVELEEVKSQLLSHKKDHASVIEQYEAKLDKLFHAYVISKESISDWDAALTAVLDGAGAGAGEHYESRSPGKQNLNNGGRSNHSPQFGSHSSLLGFAGFSSPSAQSLLSPDKRHGRPSQMSDFEQARHEIAIFIERFSLKVDRILRVRSIFDSSSKRLVKQLEQSFASSQEKCALLTHRLSDAHAEMARIKATVDRDRESHQLETREMRNLREVLLSEHAAKVREYEGKVSSLLLDREHDKAALDQLNRHAARLQEENLELKSFNAQQKEELKALEEAEAMLSSLSSKLEDVVALNRSLEKELAARKESIEQLSHDRQNLVRDQSSLLSDLDKVKVLLGSKDSLIQDFEARIERQMREIERLRSRQIDPDLAMTLLETQSKLQTQRASSVGGGGDFSAGGDVALVANVEELIHRTEKSLQRFERVSSAVRRDLEAFGLDAAAGAGLPSGSSAAVAVAVAVKDLSEEVHDLLARNGLLLSRVSKLLSSHKSESALPLHGHASSGGYSFSDVRGMASEALARIAYASGEHSHLSLPPPAFSQSVSVPAPSLSHSSGVGGGGDHHYGGPSRRGLALSLSPTSSGAFHLEELNDSSPAARRDTHSAPTGTTAASPFSTSVSSSQRTIDQIKRKLDVAKGPHASSAGFTAHTAHTGYAGHGEREGPTSPLYSAAGLRSAAAGSGNDRRINKLDRSLQNLAKKLDSFDLT